MKRLMIEFKDGERSIFSEGSFGILRFSHVVAENYVRVNFVREKEPNKHCELVLPFTEIKSIEYTSPLKRTK